MIDELLAGISDVALGRVHFRLFDETAGGAAPVRVFDSEGIGSANPAGSHFSDRRALSLPGRTLMLRVQSTPQFDAASLSLLPWMVFAGGALAAALLALLL